MAYLGVTPKIGNIRKLDDVAAQFNGVQNIFNLRVGGQVIYPGSPLQLLISLGGVLQEANVAYQINNDQITFSDPPNPGIDFFGLVIGDTIDVGEPSDGTINSVKLNQGGTFTMGGLLVNGAIAIDSSTLVVDEINHRVGIGTASPFNLLSLSGGDLEISPTNSVVFGTSSNRSLITGSNDNLVLRSTALDLLGSIQLANDECLLNNALTIKEDAAYTEISTSNTNLSLHRGGQASASLELRASSIHLMQDVIATNAVTVTGQIKTSDRVLIETNNNSDHINITDYTGISAGTVTTTSATETFDTLAGASVRGAKYLVHASYGGNVSTSEIIVTHNGTDAFVTMFADVHTNPGNAVATFDVEMSGSNVLVKATSTVGTFIQFTRFSMNV
tara:strand:- start:24450 stop:25616 length:1167 start_codon:yes stop_codon:yes gene_type:complete